MESNNKPTAYEYGQTRSYFAVNGVSQSLINKWLPANLYATATRKEIAEQRLGLVRELADDQA